VSFPVGASTVQLLESIKGERCFCCSIICTPADDEGRCSKCVQRNAWPCPDCNVHVYEDERHTGGRCESCHESATKAVA
jgi:hypothetical protein